MTVASALATSAAVMVDVTGEDLVELNESLSLDVTPGIAPIDLALWLDAGDISADGKLPADGALITGWQDKSGNDRDLVLGGGAELLSELCSEQRSGALRVLHEGVQTTIYLRQGQPVLVPKAPTQGWVRVYHAERFLAVGEVQDDGRIAPKRLMTGG